MIFAEIFDALMFCFIFVIAALAIRAGFRALRRGKGIWGSLKKFLSYLFWHMP
jgi:hypothetical protein